MRAVSSIGGYDDKSPTQTRPYIEQIRPKRKDHKRSSRDVNWIKQNQYDAICAYVNDMSDKSLARFVVDITNAWVPDTKPPRHHSVAIPFYMRFEDVVWIAKAATGTEEESTRD